MVEFSKEDIQTALTKAIRDVMKNDSNLLEINGSERGIVHWLALYFDKHIKKIANDKYNNSIPFNNTSGYVVDVEYNRMGTDKDSKRMTLEYCEKRTNCMFLQSSFNCCPKMKECEMLNEMTKRHGKFNIFNRRNRDKKLHLIVPDMILHQRGTSNNILCVEVKTTSTPQTDYKNLCDISRIKDMVTGNNTVKYQFGAAIHIYQKDKAKMWFFSNDEVTPGDKANFKNPLLITLTSSKG